MKTRTIVILLTLLTLAGIGICYYFYDRYQKAIAEEELRDSIRRARLEENARYAAIDQARRDSIALYQKTHSQEAVRRSIEKIIDAEIMTGRNKTEGENWSTDINELRKKCVKIAEISKADSVFQSFSFRGLMGSDVHVYSYDITNVYYITQGSAYAEALFDIGSDIPEGQRVIFRLAYEEDRWVIDDFTFVYEDGYRVSEKREMKWFSAKWDPNREEQPEDIDL